MTTVISSKMTLISTGYAEMPADGKRYRFLIERYHNDDGSDWGRIVSREEIPDVGPYLWIPSYGATSAAEADYLREEYEYEKDHPNPGQAEWEGERQEQQARVRANYDEARDARAAYVKRNPVTKGT